MRILDAETKTKIETVIKANLESLKAIEGFVDAEPGFPVVDGSVLKEPSIIVFVKHKKPPTDILEEDRSPRQLDSYRVSVMQADPMRQIMSLEDQTDLAYAIEASKSELTYGRIEGDPINEEFTISEPMICHVGPDAGWPVLKPFLEATEKTLTIAMYDFNADYIAKSFIDLVRANELAVALAWDDSMTAPEKVIRGKLRSKLDGLLDGWIVKCGASRRFASAYHEKVAVRDSESFWLSSGNWSTRSQPNIDPIGKPSDAKGMYSKGNREWHIIVKDESLSALFEQYIKYDIQGSKDEDREGEEGVQLDERLNSILPDLFVPIENLAALVDLAAPVEPVAPEVLPSEPRDIKIQPLLTPDNYIGHIVKLFKAAKRSIYLQYSYITWSALREDKEFREMLELLAELSYEPSMDIKIIVGSADAADKIRLLVQAGFKETVFKVQSNIHNKGIVVDGKIVLVSSANWSGDGVLRNRDAGLLIHDKEIAQYYQAVFLYDWENRAKSRLDDDPAVLVASKDEPTPAGMVRMSWRDYYG